MQGQVTEGIWNLLKWIFERTLRKTRKNTVDRFLISFLVPEISALKEVQNGTKSGSPIVKILVKLWRKQRYLTSLGSRVSWQVMKSTIT